MPRSQLKACRSAESKRDHAVTATSQHTRTHNTMKKEAARTRIYRETQGVARKMQKLLLHESPRRRMESVTPRGLDVTCFFRLEPGCWQTPRSQLKARRPRRRNWNPGPHGNCNQSTHTRTHNTMKKEAARTRISGETQHVARRMNKLLRHERPRRRMESVTALWA